MKNDRYFYAVITENHRTVYDRNDCAFTENYGTGDERYFGNFDNAVKRFNELRTRALEDIENVKKECPEDEISVDNDRKYIFSYTVTEANSDDLVFSANHCIRLIREAFAD